MKITTATLRHTSAALLALALAAGVAVRAEARSWHPITIDDTRAHTTADGNLVDVQVRFDGRTAPLYFRPGTASCSRVIRA